MRGGEAKGYIKSFEKEFGRFGRKKVLAFAVDHITVIFVMSCRTPEVVLASTFREGSYR